MTLGPEKVQERLTRKPPPGRLLQHTPRRQPLQKTSTLRFFPFVLPMSAVDTLALPDLAFKTLRVTHNILVIAPIALRPIPPSLFGFDFLGILGLDFGLVLELGPVNITDVKVKDNPDIKIYSHSFSELTLGALTSQGRKL